MSSLIDDLLNLSRPASAPLQHVPVDMTALAKSILGSLAQGSERHVEIAVADGCVAIADEGLITVVLENLLRNAWKYSSRKDPARIEFGCLDEGEERIYFVRDNGAGFDNAHVDRLFRPFQRLHSQAGIPRNRRGSCDRAQNYRAARWESLGDGIIRPGSGIQFYIASE